MPSPLSLRIPQPGCTPAFQIVATEYLFIIFRPAGGCVRRMTRRGAGQEAERRRRAFMEGGQAGELNVLHYVYAYVVRPLYVPDYNI